MTRTSAVPAGGDRFGPMVGAVATGLMLTAALPPVNLGPLATVALVPLLLGVNNCSISTAARAGWVAGVVHYLTFLYWVVFTMHTYGGLPYYQCVPALVLLAAYLAIYPAALAGLWVFAAPRPMLALAVIPVTWMGAEWLRAHVITGFPWGLFAYSLSDYPVWIQLADAVGVYGVSGGLVLVNTAVALAWCALRRRHCFGMAVTGAHARIAVAVALAVAGFAAGYGIWRIHRIEQTMAVAPQVSIAVAQGNIDQAVKWDPVFQSKTLAIYRQLSLKAAGRADLVVWPETATPFYYGHNEALSAKVNATIRDTGTWFMVGSPAVRPGRERYEYYNSAYLIDPEARIRGLYDKVHLVPFGEYVPLRHWLFFAGKMVAQVGDFDAGQPGTVLDWPKGRIGSLICYEVIFPELSRSMAANGADLLVTITNDAWFGRTGAAQQHFSMAAFRAVETRRAIARSANTGISGFIDPAGRVLAATGLYERVLEIGRLPRLTQQTLYVRWGDWWLGVLVVIVGVAIAVQRRSRKR